MRLGFRSGDLVMVRTAEEIFRSLDGNGTLDGLPFMPEMLEFCGKSYRVSDRVVQATMDALGVPSYDESYVREFKNNDVVMLEDLRCSGLDHGACQRACRLFWKDAWVCRVGHPRPRPDCLPESGISIPFELKTKVGHDTYFCQSSEFLKATNHLTSRQRFQKCLSSVESNNCTSLAMLKQLMVWSWWKARERIQGVYPHGKAGPTPVQVLGLQPGEWVEVKSLEEIVATLDENGLNRGLHFSPDMIIFCGERYRVRSRAGRLIAEMTGEMRGIPNTVILEGPTHSGSLYAFGGCPRKEFPYWREIWLRRVGSVEQ
jgi:hypothetical protein